MFICTGDDYQQVYGQGETLLAAFEDYEAQDGETAPADCTYYEATRIEVEVILKKKEVPTKISKTKDC